MHQTLIYILYYKYNINEMDMIMNTNTISKLLLLSLCIQSSFAYVGRHTSGRGHVGHSYANPAHATVRHHSVVVEDEPVEFHDERHVGRHNVARRYR